MNSWVLCINCGWQPEDCFFPLESGISSTGEQQSVFFPPGEQAFACPYCEAKFVCRPIQSEARPNKTDVPFASEEACEGATEE